MAYRDQPFVGAVNADEILKENFIIATGNFGSASNEIADFNVSSGDENLLRVGQTIFSVGGAVPTNATITNINGSLITMDMTASSAIVSDTIGISLPSGSYLFQSASFVDPNNEITVADITGSDTNSNYDYAVLGVAKRDGSTRKGVFHIYEISEVVYSNIGNSEISFFTKWGEEGTEASSGDTLQQSEKAVAIVNLTDTGSMAPGFSRAIAGLESIKDGSEYAGFNIAISQYLSDISGSSGTTATGSFTGSFTGSLDGTSSFADSATSASYALYAVSASYEIITEESSSFSETASLALSLSPEATASFADSATSASYALTASHALNVPDTSSHALTAVSASIADELSQLATASFADSATSASYALYAVSASYEIIHEESSSFSETSSLALSLSPEATASYALTASHALNVPTNVESASYAATSSIRYDSGSGTVTGLSELKINDFDDNVGVTFQDSKLTLTFGSPTVPSISKFFNSGFATDRFNKVEDASTVTANWSNGGYTFVSASILTGSIVLTTTVDAGDTNLTLAQTTSGSQQYILIYTGSSPLDGSEYKLSQTVTSTLSKNNPSNPSISDTATIQLGDSSNQFEQGATGSVVFSSAYGSSNGWDQVSLVNTPSNSPLEVTGSATGSSSLTIQSVASYESPSGENDPQTTTTRTTTTTFSKIRSVRYGASAATSFTQAQLEDLGAWDTSLGGDIGTIDKGNTNPSGDTLTITWSGDKYQYIIYDSNRSDLSGISTSGFGVIGQFTKTTVGNYTVYKTNTLQAGGGGSSITYNLT